jgi:hypothetical protein
MTNEAGQSVVTADQKATLLMKVEGIFMPQARKQREDTSKQHHV